MGEEGTNSGDHPLNIGGLLTASAQEPYRSGAKRGVKAHNGMSEIRCHDAMLQP